MSFQQAYPGSYTGSGAGVPRIIEKSLAAAQVFVFGALLLADASDNFAECAADPAAIAAVSVSGAGPDATGFNRFARVEFPPGKMQGIATNGCIFTAKYLGGLPGANGATYGVTRDADLFWKVDFTKNAANQRVKLLERRTNSPENIARVVVSFLAANVQII